MSSVCQVSWTYVNGIPVVSTTMLDSLTPTGEVDSANGAIALKNGVVVITKGSAAALTLAAPTATTDDNKILRIVDSSGFAHTVTTPANKINGNASVATFSSNIGASIAFIAYQGVWYTYENSDVIVA